MNADYNSFTQSMIDAGLPGADPVADGEPHRFHVDGDRAGSKNGWFILYGDGVPAGSFGSWRTGETHRWCSKSNNQLTDSERQAFKRQMEEAKRQREVTRAQRQLDAASKAARLCNDAAPADANHTYLHAKHIEPYNLRQADDVLLAPMHCGGRLVNIQRIRQDGTKRFLFGGQVTGAYYPLVKSQEKLFICEGVATAHTIHQLQSASVIAAMNCQNLLPVAKHFRQRYPNLPITIAADNDHNTPGNPGLTKAHEAAAAVDGLVVWPRFPEGHPGTDFNDKYLMELDT